MNTETTTIQTHEEFCGSLGIEHSSIPEIDSFEKACEICGHPTDCLPDVSKMPEKHQKATLAASKLFIISEAFWKEAGKPEGPSWRDGSWKYYPWPEIETTEEKPSGSGLSSHDCVDLCSCSCVGSRLCFPSWEIAKYVFHRFKDLYEDLFLIG